jgi:glycosyltransferase involved in cell wall biosynthesis
MGELWRWPEAGWWFAEEMGQIPAQEWSDPLQLGTSPAVSVLMLTYNHCRFIEQAVASVLAQRTDAPFELLIGDDGSTDGTWAICQQLQRQHPATIRLIHTPENVGIRHNFLRVLIRCRAPLVALLEGDDYWIDPSKLQQQQALIGANPGYAMVATATQNRINRFGGDGCLGLTDLLKGYPIHTSSLLFRKELAIPFPRFPGAALDSLLIAHLAQRGDCGYLNHEMSYYRRHADGIWTGASRQQRLQDTRACIAAMDRYFQGRYRQELIDREFWCYRLDWQLTSEDPWRQWQASVLLLWREGPAMMQRSKRCTLGLVLLTGWQWLLLIKATAAQVLPAGTRRLLGAAG